METYNLFGGVQDAWKNFNPDDYAPEIPREIRLFLGRLSMLQGVPTQYLVPDEQLLQKEIKNDASKIKSVQFEEREECGALRFFFIDASWIQCLLNGALSIGPPSETRVMLTKAMTGLYLAEAFKVELINRIKKQLGTSYSKEDFERELKERLAEKMKGHEGDDLLAPPRPTKAQGNWRYTGFLLRSSLVSGWKGLEVQAKGRDQYDSTEEPRELQILRWERLADDTIFCVCEGVIAQIVITQPVESLHFGINGGESGQSYSKKISGISNPKLAPSERKSLEDESKGISILTNESRIIDVRKLATDIKEKIKVEKMTSKEFAMEMVSKPIQYTVNLNWKNEIA